MSLSSEILAGVPSHIVKAAKRVKLVLLDVDGVLTDGKVYYGNSGEELKAFNIKDGLGIRLLNSSNIMVGIVTGRTSKLVLRRAKELNMATIIQNSEDKFEDIKKICLKYSLKLNQICFVGDDFPDLRAIQHVGLGISVADGCLATRQIAKWCTNSSGGNGAVREVAELLLASQGKYQNTLEKYR